MHTLHRSCWILPVALLLTVLTSRLEAGFTYVASSDAITITGYDGSGSTVVIPDTIDGLPVQAVADYAFDHCSAITTVTLPSSLKSIGSWAFNVCSGLNHVVIPNSVTSIGDGAFSDCSSLADITLSSGLSRIAPSTFANCHALASLEIPSGVANIGNGAFFLCTSLASVALPMSVTSIDDYAFSSCTALAHIDLPNGLTSIGKQAFFSCTGLSAVTIPGSVISLGDSAFAYCYSLSSATFSGDAPTMGTSVFERDSFLFQIYYHANTTGFTSPTWLGYPASLFIDSSSLSAWLTSHGFDSNVDVSSSPNNDGVSLLMEYALDLDPSQNQSQNLPQPMLSGIFLTYRFFAGRSDVTYKVQYSTDLETWYSETVAPSGLGIGGFHASNFFIYGNSQFFVRLVVSH